jgi:pentose-5-phosphate-3-epimerase
MWRLSGAREIGIAVLMDTPLSAIMPYASLCDEILVMTIATVGKQGIPFDERGIARVRELRERLPRMTIAADGGISEKNIHQLAEAGASRFCIGSAIEKQSDPAAAYTQLCTAAAL